MVNSSRDLGRGARPGRGPEEGGSWGGGPRPRKPRTSADSQRV